MKCKHIFLVVLNSIVLTNTLSSQSLNFKHFTSQDGLPSSTVYEALQDRDGFMWFATGGGVSRFDGYSFTNFTIEDGLADNEILGFFEDSLGRLWFRSLNGKISYYFKGKIYNSQNTPSLKALDKPSLIRMISETSDHKILITHYYHGLSTYSTQQKVISFPIYQHDKNANYGYNRDYAYLGTHAKNPNRYLVLTTSDLLTTDSVGNLIQIANGSHTIMQGRWFKNKFYVASSNLLLGWKEQQPSLPLLTTPSIIIGIWKSNDNSIWICTERGVVHFNLNTGKESSYLETEAISSVIEDREGNVWFTTLQHGIFMLPKQLVRNYRKEDGLSSNNIFSIDVDSEGIIWLGHDNFNLTRIDKSEKISILETLPNIPERCLTTTQVIYEVNLHDSEFLIAGVYVSLYLEGENVNVINLLNGRSIRKWFDDTYIVAAGRHGLRAFSKQLVETYKQSKSLPAAPLDQMYEGSRKYKIQTLYKGRANCLFREKEGVMWAGTDNGLLLLTKDSVINYFERHTLLKDRILNIERDSSGTLFLATANRGIVIHRDDKTSQITRKNGLSSNTCNILQLDGNTLWAGTNAGVNKITLNNDLQPELILTINTSHGIPSNNIHDLLVDDKNVWIGVSGGLSVLNKYITATDHQPPVTHITTLAANGQLVDTTHTALDYKQNNLKINFVGLSYRSMGNIQYKYKLTRTGTFVNEGADWQETKNTSVDFSSLPSGDYTFEVMAQNSSGVWGTPAHLNFTITPPYWETWWFRSLTITTIFGISLAIIKYVQRSRRRKQEERKKLQLAQLKSLRSQMNFHFMSNAFNSLQGLFVSDNGVDQYLGKFSRLMRFTLEYSDRQRIPLSEELNYLQLYCDIEQLRVGDKFTFTIDIEPGLKNRDPLIPALTLQPFIENAIWHGIMPKENFGTIRLKATAWDSDCYQVTIEDDGIGINTSLSNKVKNGRKSFGTKLIMDRFEVIRTQSKNKFAISIADKADINQTQGTRVTIIVPFHYDE